VLETCYRTSSDRLLKQLSPIVGDLGEPEGALQEAYVRAAARWPRLREYDRPEAWVRMVALNLVRNAVRRLRRRTALLLRSAPPEVVPELSADAVDLANALRRIPFAHRQVLVLHYLARLPVDQGGSELALTPSAGKCAVA